MKAEILWLMKKRLPIAMALGTAAQLALAFAMIWYAQGGLKPAAMEDEDAEAYFMGLLEGRVPADGQYGVESVPIVEGGVAAKPKQQSELEITLLKDDGDVKAATPLYKPRISVRETWEMERFG